MNLNAISANTEQIVILFGDKSAKRKSLNFSSILDFRQFRYGALVEMRWQVTSSGLAIITANIRFELITGILAAHPFIWFPIAAPLLLPLVYSAKI